MALSDLFMVFEKLPPNSSITKALSIFLLHHRRVELFDEIAQMFLTTPNLSNMFPWQLLLQCFEPFLSEMLPERFGPFFNEINKSFDRSKYKDVLFVADKLTTTFCKTANLWKQW